MTKRNKLKNPKISVITPSYNSGKSLERAIKSVLEQGYVNFEHVVVDGGSTDETLGILKEYPHLRWVSKPDKGQADAMNKGFKMSTGEVIVYLNADDYFFPGAFEAVSKEFEKGAEFVLGDVIVKSPRLGSEFLNVPRSTLKGMLRHWEPNSFCHNPVGYFYTRKVQRACPFNPNNYASMDLEFLLAAAEKFNFVKIDKTLGCFEDGTDTKTGQTQARLDYWQPSTFLYLEKYINKMPVPERIIFRKDQAQGYAELQARVNQEALKNLKKVVIPNDPKVSVIIPTYNCSKYLPRAINSVLAQKLPEVEVIIVDDCSTDNTQEMLAKKYGQTECVKVYRHSKNLNLGAARNTGLGKATGKYIFFLDSDDWLKPGSLKMLVAIAEQYSVDIVAGGVDLAYGASELQSYHGFDFSCTGGTEALLRFADHWIGSIVWNKLYRHDFLDSHGILFDEGTYHEDVMFTAKASYFCEKYISIHTPVINYFQRAGSIKNTVPTELHLRSYLALYQEMITFIESHDLFKSDEGIAISKMLYDSHCSNNVAPGLTHVIDLDREEMIWEVLGNGLGAKGYAVADLLTKLIKWRRDDRIEILKLKAELERQSNLIVAGKPRRIAKRVLAKFRGEPKGKNEKK